MLSGGLNVACATNTGTANEALTSRSKDMYSRLEKETKARETQRMNKFLPTSLKTTKSIRIRKFRS